ncbi:flavin reductase family protein [Amycolatopsis taiwanensis]|uniref:Oxidoreductase n=1 Tax=Amycolatopsis taiwanensis TaxID=342230 RepID=A0A9W6VGV0_9PSEU|nr:flavin reductase family protein [Amycolatopsis taiwanensis]GLY66369.1 oxidoreductase [Amycolatopsis taiwanensis]
MLADSPTLTLPDPVADQPCETTEEFNRGARHLANGVAVITACDERGARAGVTSTGLCTLGAEPPTLLVCVPRHTGLGGLLPRVRRFAVNALSRRQRDIAEAFAGLRQGDRFGYGRWSVAGAGSPMVAGALASFECAVDLLYAYPKHLIVVGTVRTVIRTPDPEGPLVYSSGQFGRLELAGAAARPAP